jgi:hypothetical protein
MVRQVALLASANVASVGHGPAVLRNDLVGEPVGVEDVHAFPATPARSFGAGQVCAPEWLVRPRA